MTIMLNQKSIVLLICWYGDFPWYFPYFVHSCGYNLSVDFVIITDNQEQIKNKPGNLRIIHKSLDEVKLIASEKLGFHVCIDYPYKLCDFKPAYGFIFNDIIFGYDFWGISDIDIVYGNIREFITDDVLNSYDVISSRHDYITGSFCLFKNNDWINSLFMRSKDFMKVFCNSEHFCFDECNFLFEQLSAGHSILEIKSDIESMTHVVKKAENNSELKALFEFMVVEGTPGRISWNKGHIYYKNTFEAMLYHLVRFKNKCNNAIVLNPIPDIFYFTPTKIIR